MTRLARYSTGFNTNFFVGHDGREAIATEVCERSMRKHASQPLQIQRICEPALRHIGMFNRKWKVNGTQRIDVGDGRPFSTEFAFTRFLVPSLMQHRGFAVFCDGDFLLREDIWKVFEEVDPDKAVHVVKHQPRNESGEKMDGRLQQPYYRKNWSSFVVWNCAHPANQRLTPLAVNREPGQWLHAFSWLEDTEIGALDPRWNYLVGLDKITADAKAAHFTLGIPTMPGHENDHLADEWRSYTALGR